MSVEWQERHQDYVLGPNQDARLAAVTAGQAFTTSLRLDSDAPFVLRSRAMRIQFNIDGSQGGLENLALRFTGPYRDQYFSRELVRQSLLSPYFGQNGNSIPMQKPITYPASSVIYVDLVNLGAGTLTNLTLYFRGVKLYPWGARPAYRYPSCMSGLPFIYPQTVPALGVTETRYNQSFQVKNDADFVLRSLQAGRSFLPAATEVFIRLKDFDQRAYSNDFVHVDILAGHSGTLATYPVGGVPNALPPIGTGAASPGLLYPEVYMPRNQVLYFDIMRTDGAFPGALAADFPISFCGMKAYQR